MSGGKHKSYIQYQEKDSKKWKSIVHFVDSHDYKARDIAMEVFDFLCDNPSCSKDKLIEEKKIVDRFTNNKPAANPQADGGMEQDEEESPRCTKLRFCEFWDL